MEEKKIVGIGYCARCGGEVPAVKVEDPCCTHICADCGYPLS